MVFPKRDQTLPLLWIKLQKVGAYQFDLLFFVNYSSSMVGEAARMFLYYQVKMIVINVKYNGQGSSKKRSNPSTSLDQIAKSLPGKNDSY